ncbi:MAG: Resolvase domain protein [Solirubrobacterales bacterium]|nr:Resolvase domain protein [Solirubrobacterales bacterium]
MRVIGYVRCSTYEQSADGLSLEAQANKITAWCELASAELVEIVVDGGVSGTKALSERPGGARIAAMLDARRPSVDAVVIVRLDRLGRDAAETLMHLRRFASGSLGLVSVSDRVDLSSPQGRAMAQMGAIFAELERALIGQRTAEALAALREQGRTYGPVPYGYAANGGRLIPTETEQSVLERIRHRRERGDSYALIADVLNDQAVPAKRGGRWHAMSVRSVLRTSTRLTEIEMSA